MRIGLGVPYEDINGKLLTQIEVLERAKMIEDAGFEGIWCGDASFYRGKYTQVDPLLWIALCAAGTEEVEVGLALLQVTIREPIELAQRLMSLTALSQGRFTCGVGAGSSEEGSLEIVAIPFADRFKVFYQKMGIIKSLLDGEAVGKARLPRWPGTPDGPQLILGAWQSEASLRRAATEFNGWMTSAKHATLEDLAHGIRRFRELGGARAMVTSCPIDLQRSSDNHSNESYFSLVCSPSKRCV